jgi:uncharacterized membrane protein
MTQLICLVQSLYLGNEQRTRVTEKEVFEVDKETAARYILGGIAKPVEVPAEKQSPAPAQAAPVDPAMASPEIETPPSPTDPVRDPEKPAKKKR